MRGVLGAHAGSIEKGESMARFAMRKNQRLKKLVPIRYLRDGIAGEGIIKDLSLSGSYITGNTPVCVGMVPALQIFVPGDPEPLLIDRATVKWIKESEFGVDFDTPPPNVAERITKVISTLVKTKYGSSRDRQEKRINTLPQLNDSAQSLEQVRRLVRSQVPYPHPCCVDCIITSYHR